jgi:hypothetical protein
VRHNFGSGAWLVVLGLAWGLLSGGLGWLLGINRLGLSEGLRRTLYLAVVVVVGSSGGLVTAVLVRPRNAAADLTAGAITGLLAVVTAYTISWGWLAVLIALRWGRDWIPYGIWLGMLAVAPTGLVFVVETLAAGTMLRRLGLVRRVLGPYYELVIAATLLVVGVCTLSLRYAVEGFGRNAWLVPVLLLLALAVTGVLQKWPWAVRALLHVAWLAALVADVVKSSSWQ